MVDHDQQHVLGRPQGEQLRVQRGFGGQVERVPGGFRQSVRQFRPADQGRMRLWPGRGGVQHPLAGLTVDFGEDRAQALVPGNDIAQGPLQRLRVEPAVQT
ncbi:hypothetical protein ADL12_08895 [Streptomyces regalis]|uniref:Uncharacterized protein n=1 Tax=Streptomyces regalis TaxID=68262 RepID=A0A0X3VH77_9ACTN|nr:hypothetical protein ADL12_08895 [Streptomyces regalis]